LSRRADDRRIAVFGFLLCTVLLVAQSLDGLVSLAVGVPVGAFCFGQARIASRNLLMGTVDTARAGHAFGLANGGSLAATAAVMPLVAAVTDHTDARWGFGTIASISALTVLAAALPLGRRLTGEPAAEPLPAASLAASVTYAAEP
ncbi:MAG: MFS transporter, partial [Actinocrinis sp.]